MTGKEYVLSVLEQVENRNSNENEFLDAVKEVALSLIPVFDKHPEYIKEGLLERIVEPERQIMFRVPWLMIQEMYKLIEVTEFNLIVL